MDIQHSKHEPTRAVVIREKVPLSELSDFFGRAFAQTAGALGQAGLAPSGPPIAIYYGEPDTAVDVAAGFPVASDAEPPAGTQLAEIPGGDAVETVYTGSYDTIGAAYDLLTQYLAQEHLQRRELMWEEYLAGPDSGAGPDAARTRIVFPLR